MARLSRRILRIWLIPSSEKTLWETTSKVDSRRDLGEFEIQEDRVECGNSTGRFEENVPNLVRLDRALLVNTSRGWLYRSKTAICIRI